MSKKTGVVLIVLSLPILVIGALHFNMIMLGLDESREPITLAITGGGVLLLAVGVSGATRPRNGILVALVGAGIMTALLLRARANGRRWHAEFESERAVKDAAEAVCNGIPHAGVTATSFPRAIMSAGRSEDKATTWYVTEWQGLPKAETAADLQLVACTVTSKATVASCSYGSGTTTSHIIFKVQVTETITVREAKTAKELGTRSFEGAKPSEKCDDSVRVSNRSEFSRDVSGGSPDGAAETAWLRTFVAPAEKP